MPVPAFYPTNYYNPYMATYQQPVQPIAPQMQNQAPAQGAPAPVAPQQNSGIIWISSERDAAMYPVAPNNAVTLWHQSEPVVYLKQADATGKPTLKTYDLVERAETPAETRKSADDNKTPAYATKDELATVVGAVKDIDGLITSLTKEVDDLKRSKKRKREEEDDD